MADEITSNSDSDDLEALLDAQLADALERELSSADDLLFSDEDTLDEQLAQALADMDLDDEEEAIGTGDIQKVVAEEAALSSVDEETILDMRIAEALALDQAEEEKAPDVLDGVQDFLKDTAIHSDDEEFVLPEKRKRFSWLSERIDGISPKLLTAIAAILTVFVVLTVVLSINLFRTMARENEKLRTQGTTIRLGSAASNNAGFIFVDASVDLAGRSFHLSKINLSRISSVLYFNGRIDLELYDFSLTDDWGRVYHLDYSYADPVVDNETRLWFDPLPMGFQYFLLTITERDSQISAIAKFTAGQEMQLDLARYVDGPVPVDCDSEDTVMLALTDAAFSNTGSQIGYALKLSDPNERVILGKEGEAFMTLSENSRLITRDAHAFPQYTFDDDGVMIGRIDFEPLQNLNSLVRVHFDNLYKRISVNQTVSFADIFYTLPNHGRVIDVGPYQLVIERGGVQVNQFILVMHAIDTRLPHTSELSNRVQAFPDVVMVARKRDGSSIRLEPRLVRDTWQGTDVVFDGGSESQFLLGIPIDNISFEISGVQFKLPPTAVEFNLADAERRLGVTAAGALENLDLAFKRRLGYKAGMYELRELDRFAPEVKANDTLMREYAPMQVPTADSAVHVPMWYQDDMRFYAIVRETWRAYPDVFFHRVHKVVSEYGNRGWIIIDDEIISER